MYSTDSNKRNRPYKCKGSVLFECERFVRGTSRVNPLCDECKMRSVGLKRCRLSHHFRFANETGKRMETTNGSKVKVVKFYDAVSEYARFMTLLVFMTEEEAILASAAVAQIHGKCHKLYEISKVIYDLDETEWKDGIPLIMCSNEHKLKPTKLKRDNSNCFDFAIAESPTEMCPVTFPSKPAPILPYDPSTQSLIDPSPSPSPESTNSTSTQSPQQESMESLDASGHFHAQVAASPGSNGFAMDDMMGWKVNWMQTPELATGSVSNSSTEPVLGSSDRSPPFCQTGQTKLHASWGSQHAQRFQTIKHPSEPPFLDTTHHNSTTEQMISVAPRSLQFKKRKISLDDCIYPTNNHLIASHFTDSARPTFIPDSFYLSSSDVNESVVCPSSISLQKGLMV